MPMESSSPIPNLSLPKGGGALQGVGETFSPDLFTHRASFLSQRLSTDGNSSVGPGWQLSIPGIARKTSDGIPRYQDTGKCLNNPFDIFISRLRE